MLPSKPKSGLSDSPNKKITPSTPPSNKSSRAGSTRSSSGSQSALPSSRISPKSVDLKPAVPRRPQKSSSIADKSIRSSKVSELPTQPDAFEEDLKKVKDHLAFAEEEKARALEELQDAKRLALEANAFEEDLKKVKDHLAFAEEEKARALEELQDAKRLALEANAFEEDLKKVKDHLAFAEQEKARALEELQDAKRLALEANAFEEDLKKVKDHLAFAEQEKARALEELQDAKRLALEANAFEEDLKKVKDHFAFAEQEKARALEELQDAKRLALEANEKLNEALSAQKRAEETKQAGVEAAQMREEEWKKELENIRKQHSSEVEVLHSTTQELEKTRQELGVNIQAKNNALTQVRNATKKANTYAEKVEFLSVEVRQLKSLLNVKLESLNSGAAEIIRKLDSDVDVLKNELVTAKAMEDKLDVMETLVERLSTEADVAKRAELDSCKLVDDWKKKAESLEVQLVEVKQSEQSSFDSLAMFRKQLEESNALLQVTESEISCLRGKVEFLELQLGKANRSEKSSLETLNSLMEQLRESNASLQDAESETAVFRGKVESLEIEVAEVKRGADEWKKQADLLEAQLMESKQHKKSALESLASVSKQLEESNTSLQTAESENAALKKKLESLEIEVAQYEHDLMDAKKHVDIERQEAIDKAIASNFESILEERNQLITELDMSRVEEEKAKKAMDGLALSLHEVSTEAREAQERLFTKRVEFEDAHAQIDQLRSALKNTEENYEVMLDEARYEIVCLKKSVERFEIESNDSKAEWDTKELNMVSTIKTSEEEIKTKMQKSEKEGGTKIVAERRLAESNDATANEALEAAKTETLLLKANLHDRENELHVMSQENDLSTLHGEATTGDPAENGEMSISEDEYDLLPNSKEIPVENMNGSTAEKPISGDDLKLKEENHRYLGEEEPVEVEVKMWEGYKTMEKDTDLSTLLANEDESLDDLDLKMLNGSFDQTNGFSSETIEDGAVSPTQQHLKKKKPLFHKFGSLLKKKNNHK